MSLTQDELKTIFKKALAEHDVAVQAAELREEMRENQQPKETHAEHILGCKDCFKDTMSQLVAKSEVECADCHLPLGPEKLAKQLDECPSCKGKNLRKIER